MTLIRAGFEPLPGRGLARNVARREPRIGHTEEKRSSVIIAGLESVSRGTTRIGGDPIRGEATPRAAAQIRRGRAKLDKVRSARRDFRPTVVIAFIGKSEIKFRPRRPRKRGNAPRCSDLDSTPKTHIIRVQETVCLRQTLCLHGQQEA